MTTHSSILAWRIPWTEGSWGCRESDTTEQLTLFLVCFNKIYILVSQPNYISKKQYQPLLLTQHFSFQREDKWSNGSWLRQGKMVKMSSYTKPWEFILHI